MIQVLFANDAASIRKSLSQSNENNGKTEKRNGNSIIGVKKGSEISSDLKSFEITDFSGKHNGIKVIMPD